MTCSLEVGCSNPTLSLGKKFSLRGQIDLVDPGSVLKVHKCLFDPAQAKHYVVDPQPLYQMNARDDLVLPV